VYESDRDRRDIVDKSRDGTMGSGYDVEGRPASFVTSQVSVFYGFDSASGTDRVTRHRSGDPITSYNTNAATVAHSPCTRALSRAIALPLSVLGPMLYWIAAIGMDLCFSRYGCNA
jgi:hypothetical protein